MPVNPDDLLDNMYAQLHASSELDAVFVDDDRLLRFLSDAIKSFAQRFGVFVVRYIVRSLVQGTLYYHAPPRHLDTMHIAILESGKPLVASSTKEQEMRATAYATTQATSLKPIRWWIEDKAGVNRIGIVPVPGVGDSGNHLDIVYHEMPCDIADGIETIATFGDYLEVCAMREAYQPDSDFNLPESVQSYDGLAKLYETAAQKYWGKAQ